MDITEIIAGLRKHGLSNGGSLGWHSGLCDEAADLLEELYQQTAVSCTYENGNLVSMTTGDGGRFDRVVHAHWVKLTPDQRDYFTDYTHYCSKCGEWGKKHYKRCRECGAVMDEKVYEPTPIGKLIFSMRVYKRLKQAGILTMEQLQETDKQILHNIAGLGKQSILEIEEKLAEWKEKNNG